MPDKQEGRPGPPLGPSGEPGLQVRGGLSWHPARAGFHPTALGPTSSTPSALQSAPPPRDRSWPTAQPACRKTDATGPLLPSPMSPSRLRALASVSKTAPGGTASVSVPAPGPRDRGRESQAHMNTALVPGAGLQAKDTRGGGGGQAGSWLRVGVCKGSPRSPAQRQGPTRPQPAARGRRPVGFSLGDRGSLSGRPRAEGLRRGGRWSRAGLPHSPQGSSSSDPTPAPAFVFS